MLEPFTHKFCGRAKDLDTAHEVILVVSDAYSKLKDRYEEQSKSLQEALAEIRFLRSGKKREKFINADQLLLEFPEDKELQAALEAAKKEAEQEIIEITYKRTKKAKPRKVAADTFPAHLPRETVEVAIPEDFKKRIESGEMILVRQAIRESLKFVPSKLVVVEYKEPVLAFAHTPEKEILVEGEANLGDKGRYHPSVAAQIVHGKFGMHLPYYRLQDLFASSGWTPSRSTLDYLTELVHETTQELPKLMLNQIKKGRLPKELPDKAEGIEDPQIKRLIEKMIEAKKEKKDSLDAKMWGYSSFDSSAPYDIFDFRVSRHRDGPDEILGGYQGHVMADCYSGNMSVVLAPGSKMTRMACWAHARRKIYEHHESDPQVSALPLALMNQLYDIERRAMKMSDQERGELRATESRRILDRLSEYLEGPVGKSVLPASKLGGAFNYIRNHWEALNVFVNDGALPIDNNQVERLMKRIAVGRKNWLFIGSLRAGIRNASLMSLVASALRMDLDVGLYLESVITHMLRGTAKIEELLPDRWKAAHPEAVREYREQERRDKADTAIVQATRRRVRSELRKGK